MSVNICILHVVLVRTIYVSYLSQKIIYNYHTYIYTFILKHGYYLSIHLTVLLLLKKYTSSITSLCSAYRYKGKRKTFFGSVAIRFLHNCDFEDETKLLISALHGAAVLGSDIHIKWDTTIGYETDEVTVTPNGNDTIIVRFPKYNVELIFTQRYRGGYFLGFAFSDSAGYTPLAHGLIGTYIGSWTHRYIHWLMDS